MKLFPQLEYPSDGLKNFASSRRRHGFQMKSQLLSILFFCMIPIAGINAQNTPIAIDNNPTNDCSGTDAWDWFNFTPVVPTTEAEGVATSTGYVTINVDVGYVGPDVTPDFTGTLVGANTTDGTTSDIWTFTFDQALTNPVFDVNSLENDTELCFTDCSDNPLTITILGTSLDPGSSGAHCVTSGTNFIQITGTYSCIKVTGTVPDNDPYTLGIGTCLEELPCIPPVAPQTTPFDDPHCYGEPMHTKRRVQVGKGSGPSPMPQPGDETVWRFLSFAPGPGSDVSAHSNGELFTESDDNDEFDFGNNGNSLRTKQFATGLNGNPIYGTYTFEVFIRKIADPTCVSPNYGPVEKTIYPNPDAPVPNSNHTDKEFCYGQAASNNWPDVGVIVENTISADERVVWRLTGAPANSDYFGGVGTMLFKGAACNQNSVNFGDELRVATETRVIKARTMSPKNNANQPVYGTYTFMAYVENCATGCVSPEVGPFSITIHEPPVDPIPGTTMKMFCWGDPNISPSLPGTGVNVTNTLVGSQRIVWELVSAPANSDLTPGLLNDDCAGPATNLNFDGEIGIRNSSKVVRVNDVSAVNNIGDPITGDYVFNAYMKDCATGCISGTVGTFTIKIKPAPPCSINGPLSVCPNSPGHIYDGPAGLSYAWTISGNGTINGATDGQSATVDAGAAGTYDLTLTTTNGDGCESTCSITVAVEDNIDPVITCPADVTKECDESTSSIWTGVATATDNCAMPPAISESDVSTQGAPGCPYYKYTITRTWTADDGNGNTKSCDQIITVDDTTGPDITCPADVTVECDADHSPANTGSATAVDNCDTQPVAIASSDATTPGNCPKEWTITRTWTATDVCGNSTPCDQTITVEDTTPPVITCPADVTVECSDDHSSAANGVATATDNCSAVGDITIGESDATTPGSCAKEWTITRTWTATDECGKSSSCDQTINVEDTTAPVITCPADVTVECDADNTSAATGLATATDNCSAVGDITIGESDATTAGACPQEWTITRTWTATDECGQSSSCDQTIDVVDTTAPVMSCGTLTVTPNADGTYTLSQTEIDGLGAGSSDNCGNVTFTAAPSSFDCADEGANTVTVTGTDECGNSSSCDATVTVEPYLTITSCTATDETCAGAGDGSIAIVATALGGQVGYSVDGGANFQFNGTFNNLTPGTYNIVVRVFGIAEICEKTETKTVGAGGQPQVWHKDIDGDGYSDGNTQTSCSQPTGYIANPLAGTDCNDNDPAINPGATETCDGLDNDCDGLLLPGETDADGDGYMVCENDCDDTDAAVNPGATEICNGIDDDCDGLVDEGVSGGLTWTGNVTFTTQAEVDAWLACYSIIDGNLTIMGGGITDLSNLIGLEEVTGLVFIYANGSLASLDGLDNLATVGNGLSIYYNFALADCCAIYDLLNNNGVTGSIMIFFNASGCNSQAEILSNCAPPVTGGGNNNAVGWDMNTFNDLTLFPNPASGEVTVIVNRNAPMATLRMMDMLGRTVFEQELAEGTERVEIDLGNGRFENGLYLVTLFEAGEMKTKQLVVQR